MRPPTIRAFNALPGKLVVDCFAGGGGASTGIEAAIGRPVDIAINHDPAAIAMHQANHPETRHYCENIFTVDPRVACGSTPVGVAWFSPSCTNHSRAKGGKPKDEQDRTTAEVVVWWAETVRPEVILLENVMEWRDWGPLDENGKPDKTRKGEDFRAWCGRLSDLGYTLTMRTLVAADYGAPTTRERLFLVAHLNGRQGIFPDPTHGKGRALPWRPASEIIDWSIPCPSIFDRKKPLVDATLRRIAAGIKKYVLDTADPFLIPVTQQGDDRAHSIHDPLRTVTAAHRGEFAIVGPTLIQRGYGERPGQAPRVPGLDKPLGTVVAGGIKHALVTPFIYKAYGGPNGVQTPGSHAGSPLGTVTTRDHNGLCAAYLMKYFGTSTGSPMTAPVPTVLTGGGRGGGHIAHVQAFLTKYYSGGAKQTSGGKSRKIHDQQQSLFEPLHTVTTKARFGLVVIHGVEYQIVDIGMRMLRPHELFAAQGFPADYDIVCEKTAGRPLNITEQTRLAGNSVVPGVAQRLLEANLPVAA